MKKIAASGLASAFVLMQAGPVIAEPIPSFLNISPTAPVVNMSAADSAEVPPDIVRISIGVTSRQRDRAAAMRENRAAMAKVTAAIKAAGIADKDIETSGFFVAEDVDYGAAGSKRRKGYVVYNTLSLTVRQIEILSDIVAATSAAGANNIGSPSYDLADKTPVIERLTRSALDKARQRAVYHARLNGYSGVKLLSVSDEIKSSNGSSVVYALRMASAAADAAAAAADAAPDFRPEAVTVGVNLHLIYEMTR